MTSVEIEDGTVQIDATIIAEAFGIAPERLIEFMRKGKVTSLSERGIDEDAGNHRLTFFCDNRRLRIVVSESGDVVQRSVVNFGVLGAARGRYSPRDGVRAASTAASFAKVLDGRHAADLGRQISLRPSRLTCGLRLASSAASTCSASRVIELEQNSR